ncbi:MAG: DUF4340 domain-containing protein [Desulfobacterales bacterium]|nr:MAG: DUF4340 domain-containing protein [Desulfobacterales bacterium]
MKLKKEYAILFIIILVLISYLILHEKDRTHFQLPAVSEIAKNRITQIEINTTKETVILNRKDKTWYIGPEDYPADPEKIKTMLDVIEKLTITALVSESKNYIRYDLNDGQKITIKAWDGTTRIRQFDIGKSATTFRHTFVKLEEDPKVYHARGDFRHKFDRTLDQLRDKNVLSFETDQINGMHISEDNKTHVIKRNTRSEPSSSKEPDLTWQTADGHLLEASAVKSLLSSLSRLDCEKYISNQKKEDFDDPLFVIKLKGEAKEYTLAVFAKTDQNATTYPAVSSENGYLFLLSESHVDGFKKKIEEILKKAKT